MASAGTGSLYSTNNKHLAYLMEQELEGEG